MTRSVDDCIDWPKQRHQFAWDGSLRDIYVHGTSAEDWKKVLRLIRTGAFDAKFFADGTPRRFPDDSEGLFAEDRSVTYRLTFGVAGVTLACHFFVEEEIELDLDPREVTDASLRGLLAFMADMGDLTGKPVVMTPENSSQHPFFRYDPTRRRMEWLPP